MGMCSNRVPNACPRANVIPRRTLDIPECLPSWNFLTYIGSGITFLLFSFSSSGEAQLMLNGRNTPCFYACWSCIRINLSGFDIERWQEINFSPSFQRCLKRTRQNISCDNSYNLLMFRELLFLKVSKFYPYVWACVHSCFSPSWRVEGFYPPIPCKWAFANELSLPTAAMYLGKVFLSLGISSQFWNCLFLFNIFMSSWRHLWHAPLCKSIRADKEIIAPLRHRSTPFQTKNKKLRRMTSQAPDLNDVRSRWDGTTWRRSSAPDLPIAFVLLFLPQEP